MRWCWLLLLMACGSDTRVDPGKARAVEATEPQTARQALEVLCQSSWNGELHSDSMGRPMLPRELDAAIQHHEVQKLIAALTSPDVKRTALFDAYMTEYELAGVDCPFRDRLASWPRELPVSPPSAP